MIAMEMQDEHTKGGGLTVREAVISDQRDGLVDKSTCLSFLRDTGSRERIRKKRCKFILLLSIPVAVAIAQAVAIFADALMRRNEVHNLSSELVRLKDNLSNVRTQQSHRTRFILSFNDTWQNLTEALITEIVLKTTDISTIVTRANLVTEDRQFQHVEMLLRVCNSIVRLIEYEEINCIYRALLHNLGSEDFNLLFEIQRQLLINKETIMLYSYSIGDKMMSLRSEYWYSSDNDIYAGADGLHDPNHESPSVNLARHRLDNYTTCSHMAYLYTEKLVNVSLEETRSALDRAAAENLPPILVSVVSVLLAAVVAPLIALKYIRRVEADIIDLTKQALKISEEIDDLEHGRKKADDLLHRLLPPAVATDLMNDKSILAESYPSVTIYFSDIVGFTSISASSTPMQVVTFLNSLYTEFDTRIDLYDVYKVETIGDAYMLVSGCPRLNGIRHAGEIGTISLDLLNMIQDFGIPHLPDRKLMLRIGVHSGPCVAAVVGISMPRYCLFGETINIASRMESTGQAMRIQISGHTKNLLDNLGKYDYDERGQVEVQENEFVQTFWLTGKDGYRFNLQLDVCAFIPKKVKLDRVIVKKNSIAHKNTSLPSSRQTTRPNSQIISPMMSASGSQPSRKLSSPSESRNKSERKISSLLSSVETPPDTTTEMRHEAQEPDGRGRCPRHEVTVILCECQTEVKETQC